MEWTIKAVGEVAQWMRSLDRDDLRRVNASVDALSIDGPHLGRPRVDSIKGSRHQHMKELRSVGGHLRVLFIFDPDRQAVLLVGGDKTNDWTGWYERNIPIADDRYDAYLRVRRSTP